MKIQETLSVTQVDDENLSFFKAIGVDYVTVWLMPDFWEVGDRTEDCRGIRQKIESHGLRWYNVATRVPREIIVGQPGRDEKLAVWKGMLRTLGDVGVPTVGYDFMARLYRTTPTSGGRGGARYSTFDYEELVQDPAHRLDVEATEDQMWDNQKVFLDQALPVAEEAGVRMALHPDDPPVPEPLGGVARIVSTLEDFERTFAMAPSDSHVMLLCQGCVAEMGVDVSAAIRRMGALGKIAYVHFRNIRGTPRHFEEVFIDEGDVDMLEAMKAYREVGFEGPFMMDHTPRFAQEGAGAAGRAYAVGYIRALIQAAYR